MNVQPSSQ